MSTVRAIYAGLRVVGVTEEDDRRDLYERVTGKRSLRAMTGGDQEAVLDELRRLGFERTRGRASHARAKRADVRYIHVLWRLLTAGGHVTSPGRAGLNAFVRSRFGRAWGAEVIDVDALTEHTHINAVIAALQDWCDREGIVCRQDRKSR